MKVGDVVFYRPKSIIFKIIRFVTNGNFGHVAICVGKIGDHDLIVEASPRGVDVNSSIWRKDMPYTIYRIPRLSKAKKEAMVNTAFKMVGQKYDFKALYSIVRKKYKYKNDKRQMCSELVFRILASVGYLGFDENNPDMVSPARLEKLMRKYIKGLKIIQGDTEPEVIIKVEG